jgi:hypothetical protein
MFVVLGQAAAGLNEDLGRRVTVELFTKGKSTLP